MAIKMFAFSNGTAVTSQMSTLEKAECVYDEGCKYISQIAEVMEASAIFSSVTLSRPPIPEEGLPDTTYRNALNYKAVGFIGDVPVVSIGPYEFSNSQPSGVTTVYVLGVSYSFLYDGGASTYTSNISKSYSGKTKKNVAIDTAYATSNGVFFRSIIDRASDNASADPTKVGELMIAKSNGTYPIIMGGPFERGTTYHGIGQIAHNAVCIGNYEDTVVIETSSTVPTASGFDPKHYFQFSTSAKQSVLVPFAGYGGAERFSYTAKGFWIPIAPATVRNGGLQKMHIDGRNCVTDGYWALQDG